MGSVSQVAVAIYVFLLRFCLLCVGELALFVLPMYLTRRVGLLKLLNCSQVIKCPGGRLKDQEQVLSKAGYTASCLPITVSGKTFLFLIPNRYSLTRYFHLLLPGSKILCDNALTGDAIAFIRSQKYNGFCHHIRA